MRKALFLAVGAALGAGLVRALRRQPALTHQPLPAPDPRADELREKLADAREAAAEREHDEAAETPIDQAEAPGEDLVERRRKVHAQGHAVAGEMRRRSAQKPKPEAE